MFSRNKAEIDDLFQEILIRLWNGFDNYEGRSTAQTWIYRVALNTAINQDKKERRRIETVPLTVDIDPYEADDPRTQQIRELYDRISRLDLIDRSLNPALARRHHLRRNRGHHRHHAEQRWGEAGAHQGQISENVEKRMKGNHHGKQRKQ